jgi:hypothetical protein
MVPGPLTGSPPVTCQLTAAPVFSEEILNLWTLRPSALVALHPVQLVSIELTCGEREKPEPLKLAETLPPLQPATARTKGARNEANIRTHSQRLREP